jgi:hypothetical protein
MNGGTYRDAISVLLPDAFGFGFPLLKWVFVFKLGFHAVGVRGNQIEKDEKIYLDTVIEDI